MKLTQKQAKLISKKLNRKYVSHTFLASGSHNENFLWLTDEDKLVLRIETNHQFKNMAREYSFLKKTEGKLGPKVFLFDNSKTIIPHNYLVEEFIEGKHPKKVDLRFIKSMALWYKQLHKDRKKGEIRPIGKISGTERYKRTKHILGKRKEKEIKEIYELIKESHELNEKVFSSDQYLVLNHGDPSRMNIFYEEENNSIRLIDWEFVHYNVAEADLSFFIWSYELSPVQINYFLKQYGYKKNRKRLYLSMIMHNWGMLTWSLERYDLKLKGKIGKNKYPLSKGQVLVDINKGIKMIEEYVKKLK